MSDLKKFIGIYDNALDIHFVSKLIKKMNTVSNFEIGKIVGKDRSPNGEGEISEIRKVEMYHLSRKDKSLTNVYFYNFIRKCLRNCVKEYEKVHKGVGQELITEITVLKYKQQGKYDYHVDHCCTIPRTLSIIILLNNDYEGGNLVFDLHGHEYKIDTKPGRLIMWPSNFLYPHKVTEVTKGTRYSIVSWLL